MQISKTLLCVWSLTFLTPNLRASEDETVVVPDCGVVLMTPSSPSTTAPLSIQPRGSGGSRRQNSSIRRYSLVFEGEPRDITYKFKGDNFAEVMFQANADDIVEAEIELDSNKRIRRIRLLSDYDYLPESMILLRLFAFVSLGMQEVLTGTEEAQKEGGQKVVDMDQLANIRVSFSEMDDDIEIDDPIALELVRMFGGGKHSEKKGPDLPLSEVLRAGIALQTEHQVPVDQPIQIYQWVFLNTENDELKLQLAAHQLVMFTEPPQPPLETEEESIFYSQYKLVREAIMESITKFPDRWGLFKSPIESKVLRGFESIGGYFLGQIPDPTMIDFMIERDLQLFRDLEDGKYVPHIVFNLMADRLWWDSSLEKRSMISTTPENMKPGLWPQAIGNLYRQLVYSWIGDRNFPFTHQLNWAEHIAYPISSGLEHSGLLGYSSTRPSRDDQMPASQPLRAVDKDAIDEEAIEAVSRFVANQLRPENINGMSTLDWLRLNYLANDIYRSQWMPHVPADIKNVFQLPQATLEKVILAKERSQLGRDRDLSQNALIFTFFEQFNYKSKRLSDEMTDWLINQLGRPDSYFRSYAGSALAIQLHIERQSGNTSTLKKLISLIDTRDYEGSDRARQDYILRDVVLLSEVVRANMEADLPFSRSTDLPRRLFDQLAESTGNSDRLSQLAIELLDRMETESWTPPRDSYDNRQPNYASAMTALFKKLLVYPEQSLTRDNIDQEAVSGLEQFRNSRSNIFAVMKRYVELHGEGKISQDVLIESIKGAMIRKYTPGLTDHANEVFFRYQKKILELIGVPPEVLRNVTQE